MSSCVASEFQLVKAKDMILVAVATAFLIHSRAAGQVLKKW